MHGVALASPGPRTGTGRRQSLVSVVAPVCDEEALIEEFCARTSSALEGLAWELILVDDGSRDRTAELLQRLAGNDPRIRVVRLSRNFGHQIALTAGLDHASGDVIVTIDTDLQDPPEVIPLLVERWQAGADVVSAVREARAGETRFKLVTARLFYRLFRKIARLDLASEAADFRLFDRRALDALGTMREHNRFLRGMSVWIGFTQATVHYQRDARSAGRSKFTLRRMARFSLDALISFSKLPLQLAALAGFLCVALALVCLPLVALVRSAGVDVHPISNLLFAVLLLGGIQLITVGIIGEYVGRIYDEVKGRPLYVVAERWNLAEPTPEPRSGEVLGEKQRNVEDDRVSA